jgi:hypothetical protein
MNPLNLALRFLLEIAALVAMALWGWSVGSGGLEYALVVVVPLVAIVAWATFAVPGDPSRGKDGLVRVPGLVRLAIELAFFGFAVFALHDLAADAIALGVALATVLHYALSFRRIAWLVRR